MKDRCMLSVCFFLILGCSAIKSPYVIMTDEYLEVVKPGQSFGLLELNAIEIDSTFGYPSEEEPQVSYLLVERTSEKPIANNASVKVYFEKKHEEYRWKVRKDPFLADFYYQDTIQIKPNTWYKVITEKYGFEVYFYLRELEGKYQIKLKPKLGAW